MTTPFDIVMQETGDKALAHAVAASRAILGPKAIRNEVVGQPRLIEHADPKGEWRPIYKIGDVLHSGHPDGKYTVDEQFFDDQIAAFKHFRDTHGYYPPILPQHGKDADKQAEGAAKAVKDGDDEDGQSGDDKTAGVYAMAWGLIKDLRVTGGDTLEAYHEYAAGVGEMVEQGKLVYTSPTHALSMTDPHTGKEFPNALAEVSFVRRPQLRNIGMGSAARHYVLNEYGFIQPTTPNGDPDMGQDNIENEEAAETTDGGAVENEEAENADALEQIMATLEAMEARIEALEGGDTENEGDDDEETENADEADASADGGEGEPASAEPVEHGTDRVSELQHTVVELEKQLASVVRQKRQESIRAQLGKGVPKSVCEALSHLTDKKLDTVLAHMSEGSTSGTVVEHGEVGNGSSGSEMTLEQFRESVKKKGLPHEGLGFIRLVENEAPSLFKQHYAE